jgi:MFS family permease
MAMFLVAMRRTYLSADVEVSCIIAGMLLFGPLASRIGRLKGSRLTALLMTTGALFLLFASGAPIAVFILLNIGTAILGFGVGGEYPLASTSATERSGENPQQHKRGRSVAMTFAMQGWGTFTNTLVLFVIVVANGTWTCIPGSDTAFQSANGSTCDVGSLDMTWRGSYLFGLIAVAGVVVYRLCFLKESAVWQQRQGTLQRMESETIKRRRAKARKLLFSDPVYAPRLLATSLCWFGEWSGPMPLVSG